MAEKWRGPGRGGSSPERQAINSHLWSMHDRASAPGSTADRVDFHEQLHFDKEWDHYHPVEGDPTAFMTYDEDEGTSG